jgi:SAM-dependent methyltransferase
MGCGHVFNREFDYTEIPYGDEPNRMFNRGPIWGAHLSVVRDRLLERLPTAPRVVEIGCGAGELLHALAEAAPEGTYVGFDPGAPHGSDVRERAEAVSFRRELFDPSVHLAELAPDVIVARHVLEHLHDPLALLQELHATAEMLGRPLLLFVEVPCIDRCFETGRTADFFYEHYSHFTTSSFRTMLERASAHVHFVEHGYGDEVVFGVSELGGSLPQRRILVEARRFEERASAGRRVVRAQLDRLHDEGARVALWGGTGKAAMFINAFGADAERFPLVVDSDLAKVGTFVPGTGQRIEFRDVLHERPVDVIVITTQWRVREIVAEMAREGISAPLVLLEHDGRLVAHDSSAHPYLDVTGVATATRSASADANVPSEPRRESGLEPHSHGLNPYAWGSAREVVGGGVALDPSARRGAGIGATDSCSSTTPTDVSSLVRAPEETARSSSPASFDAASRSTGEA